MGRPATGRSFVVTSVGIFRIAEGQVTELRATADRLGMLTQLGILPDIG